MKRYSDRELAAQRGLTPEEYTAFLHRKSAYLHGSYRNMAAFRIAEKRFEQEDARLYPRQGALEPTSA